MKMSRFVKGDIKYTLKTQKYMLISVVVIFFFFFVVPMVWRFQGVSPDVAQAVLKALLPMLVLLQAAFLALTSTELLDEEKNDKVLEHLFLVPFSPLRFLGYRFLSLSIITGLLIGVSSLMMFFGFLSLGIGDLSLLAIMFATAIIIAVPILYMMILVMLILPTRYAGVIRFIVLMAVFILPYQIVGGGPGEPILAYVIPGIAVALGLGSFVISFFIKRKLIERAVLSQ